MNSTSIIAGVLGLLGGLVGTSVALLRTEKGPIRNYTRRWAASFWICTILVLAASFALTGSSRMLLMFTYSITIPLWISAYNKHIKLLESHSRGEQ